MPDVKASPAPCDLPPAATPPPGYSMDLERCLPDLQAFPHHHHHHHPGSPHTHAPYPSLEAPSLGQCPPTGLLGSLGLRYCSSSSMGPPSLPRHNAGGGGGTPPSPRAKQQQQQQHQQAFRAYVNTTTTSSSSGSSSRLYRSMENLNWAVSDPSLYALSGMPYRSVDSEFILHCTSTTSHWYDSGSHSEDDSGSGVVDGQFNTSCSPPNPESLAFYPRRALARRDLPQLFPPWMFPAAGGMEEWAANGNGRKGLRDKLRMQSARTAEPLKPLRPQVAPGNGVPVTGPPYMSSSWGWEKDFGGPRHLCPPSPRSLSARRITSPEEIKQEVLRRLQLRRQNSSPNLAVLETPAPPQEPQNGNMSHSLTSEPLGGSGGGGGGSCHSTPERKRPPMGRLHIPTFEEFKRMRQRESGHSQPVASAPPSSGQNGNYNQSENNSSCDQSEKQGPSDQQDWQPSNNQEMETDQDNEDKVKDEGNEGTIKETKKSDAVCDPMSQAHTQENIQAQTQSQDQTPCQTAERPLDALSSSSLTPSTPTPTPSSSATTASAPATTAPICTGPAPRSPLPSTSASHYGDSGNNNNSSSCGGGIRGSVADRVTEPSSSSSSSSALASASGSGTTDEPLGAPFPPPRKESGEAPSSCCPALLLEGADLSSYGAKIYSMRDGLLGSALDLIKKR